MKHIPSTQVRVKLNTVQIFTMVRSLRSLRQVRGLFKIEYFTECDLLLLFQVPVSFLFLKSSSRYLRVFPHFPNPFYFSFHIMCFQEALPTQDATNPIGPPSCCCMKHVPLFLDSVYSKYFIIFYPISPTDFFPSFSSATFQNSQCISDLLSEVSKFRHHTQLCSKSSVSLVSSQNLSPVCW